MKLEFDIRDLFPSYFDKLQKQEPDKCVTTDAHTLLDSKQAHMALWVSPDSVSAGIPIPQAHPVVYNLTVPSNEFMPPAQAIREIPITKADHPSNTKMDPIEMTLEARNLQ